MSQGNNHNAEDNMRDADQTPRVTLKLSEHNAAQMIALSSDLINRRPFRQWLWISAICIVAAGVICGKPLITGISSDPTYMTHCIALCFLIAFIRSGMDARFIDREFNVTQAEFQKIAPISDIHKFYLSMAPCCFKDHIGNLIAMFENGHLEDQDGLVDLLHAKLRRRLRFVETISATMVTLGLVGTIVGLIGAVGGLHNSLRGVGADQHQLFDGMSATLSGMSTAFSSTLTGAVFGGVVLRLIAASLNSQADQLVGHIAEVTETVVLPAFRKAARRASAAKKRELAKSSAERTRELAESAAKLDEERERKLQAQRKEEARELAESLESALRKSVKSVLRESRSYYGAALNQSSSNGQERVIGQ